MMFILVSTLACENESKGKFFGDAEDSSALEVEPIEEEPVVKAPVQDEFSYIAFTWDSKHRDSMLWSEYTHQAIEEYGEDLIASEPSDIENFCPEYKELNSEGKLMFWIHEVASMTKYESGFKPETFYKESFKDSKGNYIYSRGLLQISIESARGYDCDLDDALDLHDPQKNLECGVRILNRWVKRDGVVASKRSDGKWVGGARYWSVLRKRSSSTSYDKIRNLTSKSEVCR